MRRITIDALERQAHGLHVRIVDIDMPGTTCGLYCDRLRTIWLADWLNDRQKLCTLQHELIHARYRDLGCGSRYDARCERRARRKTALSLISPMAYGAAEEMWDGDAWHMAAELGVTMQVLEDYRLILAERNIQ